jgi:hypothetical protein
MSAASARPCSGARLRPWSPPVSGPRSGPHRRWTCRPATRWSSPPPSPGRRRQFLQPVSTPWWPSSTTRRTRRHRSRRRPTGPASSTWSATPTTSPGGTSTWSKCCRIRTRTPWSCRSCWPALRASADASTSRSPCTSRRTPGCSLRSQPGPPRRFPRDGGTCSGPAGATTTWSSCPRLRSNALCGVRLPADVAYWCRFVVRPSRGLAAGVHTVGGIRQFDGDLQVGGVTWALRPRADAGRDDVPQSADRR